MSRKNGSRKGSMMPDTLFYDPRVGKLSLSGFRLLCELIQQFSGFNNGNLCAAIRCLRFDWNEKTLKKARRELLDAGLIEVTRPGVKRRPTLYALCHLPINDIEKHGIRGRETCTYRPTGKRKHFYPVRVDLAERVQIALAKSKINTGVKNTL